jgi:DNA-binding NtrC family response regulator
MISIITDANNYSKNVTLLNQNKPMEADTKISIAIIEDDIIHYKLMKQYLPDDRYDVMWYQTGNDFLKTVENLPEIVTLDHKLPDMSGLDILRKIHDQQSYCNVVYFSGQEEVAVVVEAYKLGAKYYIIKNQSSFVEFENAIKNIVQNIQLKKEVEQLRNLVVRREKYTAIIGESPEILKVLKLIQKVENSDFLTLITGESGTGKELVAQAIHYNSQRSKKPFVAVNVSAIPSDLVESELFGHEKGAFTGADSRRIGKFEEADNGTIFLDEIGDMDLSLQTKLLRVLQEKKITRLGSNKEISVNIRVLLATNRNLGKMVKDGQFREDLYYRVQGFLIHLPPLRERGNDLIVLANYFITEFCKANKISQKCLRREAYKMLMQHSWPGNVRELKSVIERAILISDTNEITEDDLLFSDF